jgi:hypothetical protein
VDEDAFRRVREKVPSASLVGGICEVVISGESPTEVAEKVREVVEASRSKGFK